MKNTQIWPGGWILVSPGEKAGVSPNPKAGVGWVRRASRKGSVQAKRFLETMTLLPEHTVD